MPDIKERLLKGHQSNGQDVQGAPRRLRHAPVPDAARPRRARATSSSTSTTTASSSRCATRTGSSCSWSSARRRCALWAEPFVDAPHSQDLQSAARSVRARRRELEHLLGLAAGPRVLAHPGAGLRRAMLETSRSTLRARSPRHSTWTRSWRSSPRAASPRISGTGDDVPAMSRLVHAVHDLPP